MNYKNLQVLSCMTAISCIAFVLITRKIVIGSFKDYSLNYAFAVKNAHFLIYTQLSRYHVHVDSINEATFTYEMSLLNLDDLNLIRSVMSLKGGDPAAPSGTATLLRLRPSHQPRLRRLSPYG